MKIILLVSIISCEDVPFSITPSTGKSKVTVALYSFPDSMEEIIVDGDVIKITHNDKYTVYVEIKVHALNKTRKVKLTADDLFSAYGKSIVNKKYTWLFDNELKSVRNLCKE